MLLAFVLAVWVVVRLLGGVVRWSVVVLVLLGVLAVSTWETEVTAFMDGFGGRVSSACCGEEVP